jgi:hypothetical protein
MRDGRLEFLDVAGDHSSVSQAALPIAASLGSLAQQTRATPCVARARSAIPWTQRLHASGREALRLALMSGENELNERRGAK